MERDRRRETGGGGKEKVAEKKPKKAGDRPKPVRKRKGGKKYELWD
jgi:hypothetical protein